ncbi:MAG: NAD(P)H-binding protein, partial [Allobranchiibius sp.]
VGGRLIPELLRRGHTVSGGFTDTAKADRFWWSDQITPIEFDVSDKEQVLAGLQGIQTAYYLIHGLGGKDFMDKDRESAHIFADAAKEVGVRRIVYLSGIVPQIDEDKLSDHISSRLEVEKILTSSGIPTYALRAAILLGSGSTSFEIVRQLSERLPVHTVPTWMQSQVQPIAVVDAVSALAGCMELEGESRSYDIGGSQRMPYNELLSLFTDIAGLTRPEIDVPLLPTGLVGTLAGHIADVPATTVASLVESLHEDMVCHETDFCADLLPQGYETVSVEDAFRRALADPGENTDPSQLDPVGPWPSDPGWAGGRVEIDEAGDTEKKGLLRSIKDRFVDDTSD